MDSFAAALADAVVRVKCGPSDRPPAAPPVQALLNNLLELVPERRSTVAELCDGRAEDVARASPGPARRGAPREFQLHHVTVKASSASDRSRLPFLTPHGPEPAPAAQNLPSLRCICARRSLGAE